MAQLLTRMQRSPEQLSPRLPVPEAREQPRRQGVARDRRDRDVEGAPLGPALEDQDQVPRRGRAPGAPPLPATERELGPQGGGQHWTHLLGAGGAVSPWPARSRPAGPRRESGFRFPRRRGRKVMLPAASMTDPTPEELLVPHPDRLPREDPAYDAIMERHAAAVAAGRPLYEDPSTGLWVMTAAALWGRPCCDNGCRHCPHVPR